MTDLLEVLVAPRDLVFLDVHATAAADGVSPHIWELYAVRHNTNTSAEIVALFPEHHPHPLIGAALIDYLDRAPLEIRRTPISVMQQVLGQLTRIRGQNPTPQVVVSHPVRVMRSHLQPYMNAVDAAQLDLTYLDQRLVGTAKDRVEALIQAYAETYGKDQ